VYAAAVLEGLVVELLQLASDATAKAKRKRITPEDVSVAIRSDSELSKLLSNFSCYQAARLTGVARALLPREPQPKKKAAAA